MRIYTVFDHADGSSDPTDPGKGVIFVKEGFCWPALFFPIIWMIYHRMWLVTGGYLLASFLVTLGSQALLAEPVYGQLVMLGFSLLVACEANELRRWHLREKGFVHRATIAAENLARAEQRYFATGIGAADTSCAPEADGISGTGGTPDKSPPPNGPGIMPVVAVSRLPNPHSGHTSWGFSMPEGRG